MVDMAADNGDKNYMVMLKKPFTGDYAITQTYEQHLANAVNYPPGRYNGGIDYALPVGTPVLAAADGRVAKVDNASTGYGIYVMLESPDDAFGTITTIYAHLSRVSVALNDYVHSGDILGESGYSGNVYPPGTAGAHLHFEARHNGTVVDPGSLYQAPKPAVVISSGSMQCRAIREVNIRSKPRHLDDALIMGRLPEGFPVTVSGLSKNDLGDTWAAVGTYWVAWNVANVQYLVKVDDAK